MKRRSFLSVAVPAALAGAVFAADKAEPRLSGHVRELIKDKNTQQGKTPATIEGLGLWPEAIVSPHFTERRRLPSLIRSFAITRT